MISRIYRNVAYTLNKEESGLFSAAFRDYSQGYSRLVKVTNSKRRIAEQSIKAHIDDYCEESESKKG
jgi:hypothetical protein